MIGELLKSQYGLTPLSADRSAVGAGSEVYFVSCAEGRYVLKFPSDSEMNNPEREPELCGLLLKKGLPVCRFVPNREGSYLSRDGRGRIFHLQRYIDGRVYGWNTAPEWLMDESARTLGRIHTALRGYSGLPTGIGAEFFRRMTPRRAADSYRRSLERARLGGDIDVVRDLEYRLGQMESFPEWSFDVEKLTCQSTHGDYFISQLICGPASINAVIDWTTACVHPVVWELMRSFVYADPGCAGGEIDIGRLSDYVGSYLALAPLNGYDIEMMAGLFYYQIAVCDYYGQYYASSAANRGIYLSQAVLSTRLMRWFENHAGELTNALCGRYIK